MKIIVIGGTGTIGKLVCDALRGRHEVVTAGSKSGDLRVDTGDSASISKMFETLGRFDALVSAAGKVHYGELSKMTEAEMQVGLRSKLMGQVNLVLIGQHFVNDGGSFTLTSGILNHDPIRYGAAAALVNGALDAFVFGAAIEMERGVRINVVSPGLLTESLPVYGDYFPGHETVPGARVAKAYVKSIEGRQTGQVFRVV